MMSIDISIVFMRKTSDFPLLLSIGCYPLVVTLTSLSPSPYLFLSYFSRLKECMMKKRNHSKSFCSDSQRDMIDTQTEGYGNLSLNLCCSINCKFLMEVTSYCRSDFNLFFAVPSVGKRGRENSYFKYCLGLKCYKRTRRDIPQLFPHTISWLHHFTYLYSFQTDAVSCFRRKMHFHHHLQCISDSFCPPKHHFMMRTGFLFVY